MNWNQHVGDGEEVEKSEGEEKKKKEEEQRKPIGFRFVEEEEEVEGDDGEEGEPDEPTIVCKPKEKQRKTK